MLAQGRNVMIEQPYGGPKITKDGVTVARAIELRDRFENMGASLVKSVASATNDAAGDGTTTATVLARAILNEGCKSVAAGMNPMDLRRGINIAVESVVRTLKSRAKMISTTEEIAQVGTISANGEREIGELIARAMEKVGKEGVITIQEGKTLETELDVVEGMKFDRGYISPYFVTDNKSMKAEYENPLVLVVERKISGLASILPLLERVVQAQRPLVIVAEDVESEALATLIVNKLRAGVKVVAVKAPGFGENRKANLQDIATLTGAFISLLLFFFSLFFVPWASSSGEQAHAQWERGATEGCRRRRRRWTTAKRHARVALLTHRSHKHPQTIRPNPPQTPHPHPQQAPRSSARSSATSSRRSSCRSWARAKR